MSDEFESEVFSFCLPADDVLTVQATGFQDKIFTGFYVQVRTDCF